MSLSEQEIVDCSKSDHGCDGGNLDLSFGDFTNYSYPICREDSYPYKAKQGKCKVARTCKEGLPANAIVGHMDVKPNEADLMAAVAQQPVSVAIDAAGVFKYYKSGVMNATCGKNIDHAVLVVGYGHDAATGLDYWKVKNSWAATFGENGYIRMARGKDQCAILTCPAYPVVKASAYADSSSEVVV